MRLLFIFQRIVEIRLNIYPHQVVYDVWEKLLVQSLRRSSKQPGGRRPSRFSSTTFSWPSANFLHQTCIAGLHLRVNNICAKCFYPQKTNNRMLFLGILSTATLPYLIFTNDVTWCHRNTRTHQEMRQRTWTFTQCARKLPNSLK